MAFSRIARPARSLAAMPTTPTPYEPAAPITPPTLLPPANAISAPGTSTASATHAITNTITNTNTTTNTSTQSSTTTTTTNTIAISNANAPAAVAPLPEKPEPEKPEPEKPDPGNPPVIEPRALVDKKRNATRVRKTEDEQVQWNTPDSTRLLGVLMDNMTQGRQADAAVFTAAIWMEVVDALADSEINVDGSSRGVAKSVSACKRHYQKLKNIYRQIEKSLKMGSGIGWDDKTGCLTLEPSVSPEMLDARVRRYLTEPFPHYDTLGCLADGDFVLNPSAINKHGSDWNKDPAHSDSLPDSDSNSPSDSDSEHAGRTDPGTSADT